MRFQHIGFGLALLATAAPNVGNLGNFTTAVNQARTEAKRIGQDMTELQLSQQEAEQKNAVAIERYRSGCLPVVTPDQSQYVAMGIVEPAIANECHHQDLALTKMFPASSAKPPPPLVGSVHSGHGRCPADEVEEVKQHGPVDKH